jgi:hypothetical protein
MHTLTEDVPPSRPPRAWLWSLPTVGLSLVALAVAYAAHPPSCADPTALSKVGEAFSMFGLVTAGITAFCELVAMATLRGARLSALLGLFLSGVSAAVAVWAAFVASPMCFNFG